MKYILTIILAMATCIQAVHGQNCKEMLGLKGPVSSVTMTYVVGDNSSEEFFDFNKRGTFTLLNSDLLGTGSDVESVTYLNNRYVIKFKSNTRLKDVTFTVSSLRILTITAPDCVAKYTWNGNVPASVVYTYGGEDDDANVILFNSPTTYDSYGNWTKCKISLKGLGVEGYVKREIKYYTE